MSGPGADEEVIDRALRDLREAFAATADGWRDAAREEFDRDHLRDLEWRAKHASRSLGELTQLCAEAVRRCS